MRAIILSFFITFVFTFSLITQESIPQAVNWPYTICGNGSWTMQNLTLDHVVTRGSNDDVNAIAIADDYTEFAKVEMKVTLNGLFLHSQVVEFSKTYDSGDMIDFVYTTFIPGFAPAGTYGMSYTFKTPEGKDNGCFGFTFKL